MKCIIAISILLFLCSCKDSPLHPYNDSEPFQLQYHENAIGHSDGLKIGFRDVPSDSRCATGAICVWEGVADVTLWLLPRSSDTVFVQTRIFGYVTKADTGKHISKDTVGYRVTLLQLDPYPKIGAVIQKSDYVATLRVLKL